MREIAIIIITALTVIAVLRSDITPWRLVNAGDLERTTQAARAEESPKRSADWMWNRQSPLDKPPTRTHAGH